MHQELRHQLNIHKILEKLYKGTIKIYILPLPPFFFFKKEKTKTTKTCLKGKEHMSRQSMQVRANQTSGREV